MTTLGSTDLYCTRSVSEGNYRCNKARVVFTEGKTPWINPGLPRTTLGMWMYIDNFEQADDLGYTGSIRPAC